MNPDKQLFTSLISVTSLMFSVFLCISASGKSINKCVDNSQFSETSYALSDENSTVEGIYSENIHSVSFYPEGAPLVNPYLALNSSQAFVFSFDDLDGGYENYYYRVLHCTHDWEISDMNTSEFLRGFNDQSITEIDQSFGTRQPYTHYSFSFPNDMAQPTISGNYIIQVYLEGYSDSPSIIKRFVVYEELSRFRPRIKESTIVSERRYRQEVDFDLIKAEYPIFDAYDALSVVVLQNNRWDNAIYNLQPVYIKGSEFVYDFDEENNFDGNNEFRWFDLKSLRYAALGTDSIRERKDGWHHFLTPTPRRTYDVYRTQQDINGKFLIHNDDFDSALESQYIHVHFYLQTERLSALDEVFIFGALTNWDYLPQAKMTWNERTQRYEGQLYLKQGYYNYGFALKQRGKTKGDLKSFEGSHSQTQNDYTVIAYYADPRGYDRVIGILFTDSFNN
jgi:hypothetical protein